MDFSLVFWEPNCDPGRFEVMLDAMKLQDLVTAACSLRKTPSLTHELFISKLGALTLSSMQIPSPSASYISHEM